MRELDMHPDAVRDVAAGLAALRTEAQRLTGHAHRCTLTVAHFGEPDADQRLAAAFAAQRDEATGALEAGARIVAELAEGLRASAETVAAADRHGAAEIRAAGGQFGAPTR